ncbi:MAG TPA: PxKF domain-containing protein, partial [Candidatus Limnocylindrales bacterium]|nr:PxKF domain-containing protein [Candidatus Limnocylindrales bacterium]
AAATVSETVSTEAADQSAIGTCTDHAGNTASNTQTGISIDKTAPTIADEGVFSGTMGTNDWYTTSVENEFLASDGLSGVVGTNPALISTGSAEGTGITVNSGDFSDAADNIVAGIDSAPFKIDLSDPTDVEFSSLLSGSYIFGSVPAEPTCTASDAISGLAGCVVTGYSTLVGTHTLTATATDNAGRTATASTSYTVLAWTLKGFYQPVDMSGVVNTVKAGSTVPLKFEVFAGSAELTDTGIVSALVKTATCTTGLPEDTIEVTATGSTSLRYDAAAGQFIYNWQTPKLPGRCYTVTLTTLDDSALSALFKLK